MIDLEDSYQGAMRDISLRTPELDSNGQFVNKERKLTVKIPKRVKQGQNIRLIGQDSAGASGGEAGYCARSIAACLTMSKLHL